MQPFNSAWQCSRAAHKGEDNGLQNSLWYNQLCQLETQWCWFLFYCCCFPPFDSSVFPFIPLFLSPIAISHSSPLSLCSEPSTVTMDQSKPCLKARAERGKVCVCVIVFMREREREGEGEKGRGRKLSCTVQRTATSAANDAASKRRQTNRQDTTLMA